LISVAVHGAAGAGALAAMATISMGARHVAATRIVARSRRQYAVLAAGFAGCAAVLFRVGATSRSGWLSDDALVLLAWCVLAAAAMLGRAALRGRPRRLCWWYRPAWLDTGLRLLWPPRERFLWERFCSPV
jgi:hypothetical protein